MANGALLDRLAARHGLRVRPALAHDVGGIEAIARLRFAAVEGLFARDVRRPYHDADRALCAVNGECRGMVVADADGAVVAYAFHQLRTDGDVFLREIAALSREHAGHRPLAGSAALAACLREGIARSTRRATLSVLHEQPAPLPFYRALGYAEQPHTAGYRADGGPYDSESTWMAGDALAIYRTLLRRLARRFK